MLLLVVYITLSIAISFVCSLLEAVLLSITPAYLGVLEDKWHPKAARIRSLKEDVERPLAAILTLNTIAGIVGATLAGAQAARILGGTALGVVSAIMTAGILVVAEIIPKSLAASHWKRLVVPAAQVIEWLVVAMYPVARVAQWLTRMLTPRGSSQTAVSRDEIQALVTEGERAGVVEEGETRVLANLLRMSRLCVSDVMTPSDHMIAFPATMTVADVRAHRQHLPVSRMPIYTDGRGGRRYTGFVMKDDILEHVARDEDDVTLDSLGRELLVVEDTMRLPQVFDRMAERRAHIALATDHAGRTTGIVTMEDVIETLLGMEIFDETDSEEYIRSLARSCWTERAQRRGIVKAEPLGRVRLGITGGALTR